MEQNIQYSIDCYAGGNPSRFLCVFLHHFSNDIRINPNPEKYKYWKNTELYISVGRGHKFLHSEFESLGHVERKPAIDKKQLI